MSDHGGLETILLAEGLEDLIPLPEAAQTCRRAGVAGDEGALLEVIMHVLMRLFREGRIQVWAGPPLSDERLIEGAEAERLLTTPARYQWNSELDSECRVYYVNVENLYVTPGSE